jgi:hypothetical protein
MTPFDTALRIHRREVDTVKVAIGAEVERITAIETHARAHDTQMREERALAHALPFSSDAWTARMKADRARLQEAATLAEARLGKLRAQALEAFGTMRAIEGAAERYRDEAERVTALAEQGAIDDLAAARFLKLRGKVGRKEAGGSA